ncbi:MAG: hypothetical protein BAJALOKI1v1_2150007 [Promethearchaeota archaeon]|nr:MAG: hypothetical protein BAJALOKI1v1_2150007 [Candidatus Lokiarchaeota archaeon]
MVRASATICGILPKTQLKKHNISTLSDIASFLMKLIEIHIITKKCKRDTFSMNISPQKVIIIEISQLTPSYNHFI